MRILFTGATGVIGRRAVPQLVGAGHEVVANVRNAFEQQEIRAVTRRSRGLADSLVSSISQGTVFSSPKQDLEWFEANIGKITPENCLEELRAAWDTEDRQIFIGGHIEMENGEKQIIAAYNKSKETEVAPPAEEEVAEFAYTDFGPAGKIIERKDVYDLDLVQLRFDNNVRLNLRKTDFTKDSISIAARFGGGMLTMPKDKQGLHVVAGAVLNGGGLEAHSDDDLRKILAGKTVGEMSMSTTRFALVRAPVVGLTSCRFRSKSKKMPGVGNGMNVELIEVVTYGCAATAVIGVSFAGSGGAVDGCWAGMIHAFCGLSKSKFRS